jgi:hypothetical protein
LSLACWRITGEASSIGVPLRFLSTKKIKGTMEQPDIINLLKDKQGLIKYLLGIIMDADRNTQGLLGMKERGFSTEGMLDNVLKVTAKQSQQLKHLALVALLISQSSDFDGMVGQMMIKMGRGEEALKAMFEAKLKGQG